MRRNSIVSGICFLALASCGGPSNAPQGATTGATPSPGASPASNAAYLTGRELEHAVIGRSLSGVSKDGTAYTIAFVPGGTGTLTSSGTKDPLTWNISGDVLCLSVTLRNGRTPHECDRVRAANGKYDFIDSTTGDLNNSYTPM